MKQTFDNIGYQLSSVEIEIDNTPLVKEQHDPRAAHCKTTKELDLFHFSSNYQTIRGGLSDLGMETGLSIDQNNNEVSY